MEEDATWRGYLEPLKHLWVEQGEDYHLLQCLQVIREPTHAVECHLHNRDIGKVSYLLASDGVLDGLEELSLRWILALAIQRITMPTKS